jgi:hypothetical protein
VRAISSGERKGERKAEWREDQVQRRTEAVREGEKVNKNRVERRRSGWMMVSKNNVCTPLSSLTLTFSSC